MAKFVIQFTRNYYASACEVVEAETREEAERIAEGIDTATLDFSLDGYDDEEMDVYTATDDSEVTYRGERV